MIDHVYISVSDPARSLAFYAAALGPLGWKEYFRYDGASGPDTVPDLWGLVDRTGDLPDVLSRSIWLRQRNAGETGLYLGLVADGPADVDAAYAAALQAGGRDDGAPGPRMHFGGSGYYAANVLDLDDNRLEFVHKAGSPAQP